MAVPFRPSLRDFKEINGSNEFPSDQSLGYCKPSLRDEI